MSKKKLSELAKNPQNNLFFSYYSFCIQVFSEQKLNDPEVKC